MLLRTCGHRNRPVTKDELRKVIEEEEHAHIVGGAASKALENTGFTSRQPSRKSDSNSQRKALQQILETALRTTVRKIKSGDTSYMDRARMQQLLSDVWNELPEE